MGSAASATIMPPPFLGKIRWNEENDLCPKETVQLKHWRIKRGGRPKWRQYLKITTNLDDYVHNDSNVTIGPSLYINDFESLISMKYENSIQIYLCSNDDFTAEKNVIFSDVYPYLRRLAYIRGVNFNISEIPSSSQFHSPSDHTQLREIRRCAESSFEESLCFVAFLGEKYREGDLPGIIHFEDYRQLLTSRNLSRADLQIVKESYEMDNNSKHRCYCLRRSANDEDKEKLSNILLRATNVINPTAGCRANRVPNSTLEMQFEHATSVTKATEKCKSNRCLVYRRAIMGLLRDTKNAQAIKYMDSNPGSSPDRIAYRRVSDLKYTKAQQHIQLSNIVDIVVNWHKSGLTYNNHRSYLQALADHFCGRMVDMIVRTAKSNRLSTADELTQEISHHTLLTHQYTSSCMVGMDEFKKKVLSYFGSHSPIDKYDKNKPLILYGKQGCGLTTFMANLVKQMWGNSSNAVVVVRYLATSPRSETSLSVLRSISLQIARAFGSNVAENQNYDLHNLCDAFEVCLRLAEREKPLWIFLHSLHKIEPVSLDNILLWLRRAFPNRNIRMVISAVRTPKLQHLLKSFIPERNVLEIPSLCKEELSSIFHTWLQDAGRTLTPEQEQGILKVLNKRCEPLYLRCILHECCTWKSFDGPKDIPSTEITSLFEYSLNTYSSKQVEERALTYLTASKNGLTDNEIVDLLLCDETLEMYPKEQKDIRWPTGIWVELRNLLDVYIQDTSLGDGSITWRWSHDAFREVAEQRFLPSEEIRISIHAYMSSYFDGSLGKTSEQTHRKNPHLDPGIIKHPIILTPAASGDDALTRKIIYNQRRLMELPWALINCGDWQSLEETLCDFKFIQAMCATGQVDVLKTWLEKASNMAIDYDYDPSTLLEFKYLISRDGHILRREPTLLTQQAANYPSLSAPCRWAKKTAEKKANSKTRPLPWLQLINKETVHNSEKSQIRAMHLNMKCALATKICLSPCGMKLGYICQEKGKSVLKCTSTSSGNSYFSYYSVEGDTIKSFCFSKDGTRIAIGMSSSALKILDTKRGRTVKELKDDSTVVQGACIDHVVFSGDDRLVIAAYNSQKRTGCRALCIWDMNSDRGNHLYSNEAEEGCYPHYGNITFLATSPDSDLLASVCDHGVLRIWDLRNGECLCGVNCDSMEEQTNNARHSKCFNSLSFNSKSDCLAVTFTRGIVKIYDTTRSRNCLPVLVTLHHSAKSKLVAAHYHHKLPAILFSCCDKGVVKMWNVNSVELLATTSIPAGGSVKGFVSSSHGPFVCVLADRGMAHLWNAAVEETSPVTSDPVTHITFSPDGKLVAMVHSQSNLLKIFNHRVTKAEHFLKLQVARPTSCAFSSNGDSLIAVGRTGAQICDIASGRLSPEITELFQGAVLSAVFGSNNNTICALGKDTRVTHTNNGFVRIFHGETRKLVYEFTKMVADDGGQLKVTEDGSTLACFGLDETGKEQRLLFLDADEGEFIHELAVSQTANMFAVNGGFTFAAVCDPEGKSGPTIQLWDVVQQMVVAEYLPYYNADITSISMTTDARYLLSAAKDVVHVCEIFLDDDTNGRKQKLPKISIRRQWTADTTNATTRHKIPITKNQLKCPGSSQQLPGDICDVGLFFTPTKSNITTVCTRPTIQHNPSLRIVVGDEGGNGHALELVQ